MAPPNVLGPPKPASSIEHDEDVRRALRRTRTRRSSSSPATDSAERASHRPAEVPVRDRQHRAVRAELAHRLGEGLLERARCPPCRPARPTAGARRRAPARRRAARSSSNTAMIPAEPGGRFSPIRLAGSAAGAGSPLNLPASQPTTAPVVTVEASSSGANSPTARPTPPPQRAPVRPSWSPVISTETLPSSACATRMTPSIATLFCFDQRDQRLEVRRSRSRCPGSPQRGRR